MTRLVGEGGSADLRQVDLDLLVGADAGALSHLSRRFQLDAMPLMVVYAEGVDFLGAMSADPPQTGGGVHTPAQQEEDGR